MKMIGWMQGDKFIPFQKATVRSLTRVQMRTLENERNKRFTSTLAGAWSALGTEPAPTLKDVHRAIKIAAKSRVGNPPKEVFLRFWHHAFATPRRLRTQHTCACGKGGPEPDLAHFAWHCEAAVALRAEIRVHLPARPKLTRAHLFMLKPPRDVHAESWAVTALCAIQAINENIQYALRGARGHGHHVSPAALSRNILARFWMHVCYQCEHGLPTSSSWTEALTPPVSVFRWDAEAERWRPATAMARPEQPEQPEPPEPPWVPPPPPTSPPPMRGVPVVGVPPAWEPDTPLRR